MATVVKIRLFFFFFFKKPSPVFRSDIDFERNRKKRALYSKQNVVQHDKRTRPSSLFILLRLYYGFSVFFYVINDL